MKYKNKSLPKTIINYLKKNPNSGDTLDGIASWWIQTQLVEQMVNDVAEALVFLEKKGLVKKRTTLSGTSLYKLTQ